MTQNQKELLLSDLSARVPYGVKASTKVGGNITISFIGEDTIISEDGGSYDISFITPYLFPISSITKEQRYEFPFELSLLNAFINGHISLFEDEELSVDDIIRMMDCLNRNHIDYRGLIPMGLAVDATNLNIY
jgi:hypothetical protein